MTNSAWTNETVDRTMHEVIHGAKTMLNEMGDPSARGLWHYRPLNTAWRKRLQTTLYDVMTGCEPRTAFTAFIEGSDEGFQSSLIDGNRLQQPLVSRMDTKEELLAGVLQRIDADRRHHRARGSRGKTLPRFTVGAYLLVARESRQGKHRSLMSTWTGPSGVANDKNTAMRCSPWSQANCATSMWRGCVLRRRPARDYRRAPQGIPSIGKLGRVPHPEHLDYRTGCKRRQGR